MAAGVLAVDGPIDDEQSDVRGDVDVPRVNVDGQAKVKEALSGGGSRGTGDRLSLYGDEDAGTFIELFESGRLSAVECTGEDQWGSPKSPIYLLDSVRSRLERSVPLRIQRTLLVRDRRGRGTLLGPATMVSSHGGDRRLRRALAFRLDATPGLKILAVVMWTVGAGLFAVGWWLDTRDWWEHRPFLTNLASALTGAFFAAPVALLIFQAIIRREDEWFRRRDARRDAIRQARRTLANLVNDATKLINEPDGTIPSLEAILADLQVCSARIIKCYEELIEVDPIGRWLTDFEKAFVVAADRWRKFAISGLTVEDSLDRLGGDWQFYVEHVQRKLIASELPFSEKGRVDKLNELIDKMEKSVTDVWFKDSWDSSARSAAEVLEKISAGRNMLLELVRRMPPLPYHPFPREDSVVIGINVDWFLDSDSEEYSKWKARYEKELEACRRSLEPARNHIEYIRTLCAKAKSAEKFVTKTNTVVADLTNMWRRLDMLSGND